MVKQAAHIPIINSKFYDGVPGKFTPMPYGPLDTRLEYGLLSQDRLLSDGGKDKTSNLNFFFQGTCQKNIDCATCKSNLVDCVGHFGYMDLALPVFHVGFFNSVMHVLQCICKSCSGLLVSDEIREKFLNELRKTSLDYLKRKALHKRIVASCKKNTTCPHCGSKNGVVKKATGAVLKIAHSDTITENRLPEFFAAVEENKELHSLLPRIKFDVLDAVHVEDIFSKIRMEVILFFILKMLIFVIGKIKDISLLMAHDSEMKHPLDLLLTRLPVPPSCIRPSVISEVKSGSTEDDITVMLSEIMLANKILSRYVENGMPTKTINESWDQLQVQIALYMNSEISGLPMELQPKKNMQGFAQRLKGKQGRFRGHLSGKRVDFSGRTVIFFNLS
ncbi:unnamed protein product [Dracunculus medinensis]|uniref:DNA-directed RNA polymerase subunit n=1 Tax=Dracunculus medinensis TaxID=318479 RepID=A0A0N4URZ9_DRAME|nr:unnamed protein product [Dracunculus medinensis]